MENTLTVADYLALENRGVGGSDWHYKKDHSGQRSTGIALGAVALGIAVFGGAAIMAGLNAASKARANGNRDLALANSKAIETIGNFMLSERTSRENWQNANQPSIQSYIDVTAQPTQTTTTNSLASALAYAMAQNNNGLNSAIGTDSFLKVARYSAPQPCGCDTCNG